MERTEALGRVIGQGATSTVILQPDGIVCKLFNPEFSREEILREGRMAENAFRLGLRVPKPFGPIELEGRIGLRSEYLPGDILAQILTREPERYGELFPLYLRELQRFHETEGDVRDFVSAKDLYLEKISRLSDTGWYTPEELQKMELLVRSVPDRNTLVYGDYHPKNIIVNNNELFFVDLGDLCLGHPLFDFAMIANTHFIIPSMNPAYAAKYFAVAPEQMLRLWDELFAGYFTEMSPGRQNTVKKQIMAFAILRQGLSPADSRTFPEKVLQGNVAVTKKKLLPEIDALIGSIDW